MYSKVDKLELEGKFIEADKLRNKVIGAKKNNKKIVDGDTVASTIINRIKEDIEELLTTNNLSTAIFYVEKIIENSLSSLYEDLKNSIQEVLEKNNSK